MNWLLQLFEHVPSSFWGVIVGAAIPLACVVLTNRDNDRRLRARLSHEREMRVKDHELGLRREVYLGAVEAIWAGFVSLGKIGDLEISNNQVSAEYMAKSAAVGKVQIVATMETARAVLTASNELTAAIMRLFTLRAAVMTQKSKLTQMDANIAASAQERSRMLEMMKQYNLERKKDPQKFQTIQGAFEFQQKQVLDALPERNALAAQFLEAQFEIAKTSTEELGKLWTHVVPAILAVREELGIPLDGNQYLKLVQDLTSQQQTLMGKYLGKLRDVAGLPATAG